MLVSYARHSFCSRAGTFKAVCFDALFTHLLSSPAPSGSYTSLSHPDPSTSKEGEIELSWVEIWGNSTGQDGLSQVWGQAAKEQRGRTRQNPRLFSSPSFSPPPASFWRPRSCSAHENGTLGAGDSAILLDAVNMQGCHLP